MKRTMSGLLLLLLACGSAKAALLSRAGGQAYYDDVLNITWLADANAGAGSVYDNGYSATDGRMTWASAQAWVGSLNTANYLGTSTWRLPTVSPLSGSSFNYALSYDGSSDRGYNQSEQGTVYAGATGSEMAHLFYNTLNNKGYCDPLLSTFYGCSSQPPGWGLTNKGPFSNLPQLGTYWSGTTYTAYYPYDAWYFSFQDGSQDHATQSNEFFAWAVSPGDALVPVPGAVWMLGSALGVLGLVRRKVLTGTA